METSSPVSRASFVPVRPQLDARAHEKSTSSVKQQHYYQSTTTTNVTTPDDSFEQDSDNGKVNIQNDAFEFDVKPKAKKYNTPEEYKKKFKTEMCKNFMMKGYCKFTDKCSFAHGESELRDKVHLHSNYKTKKCKQFHTSGHCFYGYRCQYLHHEPANLMQLSKKWAAMGKNIPAIEGNSPSNTQNGRSLSFVSELEKLEGKLESEPNLPILYLLDTTMKLRLPIFSKFTSEPQFSMAESSNCKANSRTQGKQSSTVTAGSILKCLSK